MLKLMTSVPVFDPATKITFLPGVEQEVPEAHVERLTMPGQAFTFEVTNPAADKDDKVKAAETPSQA